MAKREKTSKLKLSQSLSADDADYLKKNTNYTEEDLKAWYKKFQKDCPNGILEKKKVCEIYETKLKLSKDSKFLVDQLFRIIDDDNNGGIDFKEFMVAVNMAVSGTKEERLRWMFRFYDEDDSGSIELEEMCKVLSNIYQCEGLSQKEATVKAKELFSQLDIDGSGEIDKEEFVQGFLRDFQGLPKVKIEHVD